jgi:uncharacterized small protein (DUF1192 family)
MKTLAQLKAENAENEVEIDESLPEAEEVETEEEAGEEVAEEDSDSGESGDSETGETELEAWMQTEEQTSEDDDKTVPLGALTSVRAKLKGRIGERDEEIERLKAENEALKQGGQAQAQVPATVTDMPKLEDHEYDDAKYQQAMTTWMAQQVQSQVAQATQASTQTAAQVEAQKSMEKAVDDHYQRAAKLAEESGITVDLYQGADLAVRQAIESVRPKQGDQVADYFISQLGEGSEKVMYYLGRNKAAQDKLRSSLITDPSGISAALYLGELKSTVASPQKRTSRAPKPATEIKGDESGSVTSQAKRLLSKYKAAHKQGGGQAAYNAKKEAKAAGIDTSNW